MQDTIIYFITLPSQWQCSHILIGCSQMQMFFSQLWLADTCHWEILRKWSFKIKCSLCHNYEIEHYINKWLNNHWAQDNYIRSCRQKQLCYRLLNILQSSLFYYITFYLTYPNPCLPWKLHRYTWPLGQMTSSYTRDSS